MKHPFAAAVAMAGLLIAGCGTSGSSSSSSSSSASTSSASSSATTAAVSTASPASNGGGAADVTPTLSYTGGKAGSANAGLTPITIGFVSQVGGTPSYPNAVASAKAAVKYVNANLGGIDGHPLALSICNVIATEEQGLACAQQFLNSKVPLVVTGGLSNGNESFFGTLRNKVSVIEGVGGSPADAAGKNTLVLSAGVLGVGGSMSRYIFGHYKPKTVSIVAPSVAITQLAAKELAAGLTQKGVKVTSSDFAPDASDLLTPLIAADAKNADVLAGIIFTPQCATFANALKQLGRIKPTVVLDLCIAPSVKQALGGDYPKWDYLAVEQIAYSKNPSANVGSYLAGIRKYAGAAADVNDYAGLAWSAMMSGVRVLNKVGAASITRATVTKAVTGFTAPSYITPAATCGSIAASPGLCSPKLFFYHYNGNGLFNDEAPGGA